MVGWGGRYGAAAMGGYLGAIAPEDSGRDPAIRCARSNRVAASSYAIAEDD